MKGYVEQSMKYPLRLICYTILILTALPSFLSGCGAAQDNDKVLRIALITPYIHSQYWAQAREGAEIMAERLGNVEVAYFGPDEAPTVVEQIRILEDCVYVGYDGIILAASNKDALIEPIKRVKDAGIPVVMIDTGVSEPVYDALLATDNELAGEICAKMMAQLIGGEGDIAIINFSDSTLAAMKREYGFVREIAENWPDIRVVGVEYCNFDLDKATKQTENFIHSFPGIKGIWGANAVAVSGVIEGVAACGAQNVVSVIGFDYFPELRQCLESGTVEVAVVQNPKAMGEEGLQMLVDIIHGNHPINRNIDIAVTVVTKDNMNNEDIQSVLGW